MAPRSLKGIGAYGCVYTPSLPCEGEMKNTKQAQQTQESSISKIFFQKKAFQKEKAIYQEIIQTVDPHHVFTLPWTKTCKTNILDNLTRDERTACQGLPYHKNKQKKRYWQFKSYDGGEDLRKLSSTFKFSFLTMLENIELLFYGVKKLTHHGITHLDIKPANIVFHPDTHICKLIDFGLATHTSIIYKDSSYHALHAYPYIYFPPEFGIFVEKATWDEAYKEKLQNTQPVFYKYLSLLFSKLEHQTNTQHTVLEQFTWNWRQSKCQTLFARLKTLTHNNVQSFWAHNAKKIDVYMLGMTLFLLFYHNLMVFLEKGQDRLHILSRPEVLPFYFDFLHLIAQMIHPDPFDRLDSTKALRLWNTLLSRHPHVFPKKQEYVQKREMIYKELGTRTRQQLIAIMTLHKKGLARMIKSELQEEITDFIFWEKPDMFHHLPPRLPCPHQNQERNPLSGRCHRKKNVYKS